MNDSLRIPSPRRLWPFLLALFIAVVITACGGDDGGDAREAQVPTTAVLSETRAWVDTSRPTLPNGGAPGRPERGLETRLWYPPEALDSPACRGRRCAAILLAHGFGGRTSRFDALARELAAVGYIVAAPSFPRTNQDAPGGHLNGLDDLREQPADLSFVLDALSAADADPADPLYGRVDAANSGAVGHSLGGATVAAATRTTCCIDARITAAALVAPAYQIVDGLLGALLRSGPATLIIGGDLDSVIPPVSLLQLYDQILPPRLELQIAGGNHINVIENFLPDPDPLLFPTVDALKAFFDTYLGGASGEIKPAFEALVAQGHSTRSDL